MASNSAGNMLRGILGRIDDLSAEIDQQGSSLSRGTAPQTTSSVENEVRNVFGAVPQVPSSTASASSTAVSASQNGPLYTMRRNFTNFRTASYRSSRGGKRKGATPSGSFSGDVILLSGTDDEDVPRQGNRVFLQESGYHSSVSRFRNFTIGSHQTIEAYVNSSRTVLDWSNDSSHIQGQTNLCATNAADFETS